MKKILLFSALLCSCSKLEDIFGPGPADPIPYCVRTPVLWVHGDRIDTVGFIQQTNFCVPVKSDTVKK